MNYKFFELIKYYNPKKIENATTSESNLDFISSDENYICKTKITISKPILDFISLNKDLSVLTLKNSLENLGYVGTIANDLKHDGVTEDKKNEIKKILNYILPKEMIAEIGKKQIICIDEEDIVFMTEQFKVCKNRKVKDFKDISEFIKEFNELSKKEPSYPSSVLLEVVHTISEDEKNLETEIVVTFTNWSK